MVGLGETISGEADVGAGGTCALAVPGVSVTRTSCALKSTGSMLAISASQCIRTRPFFSDSRTGCRRST